METTHLCSSQFQSFQPFNRFAPFKEFQAKTGFNSSVPKFQLFQSLITGNKTIPVPNTKIASQRLWL